MTVFGSYFFSNFRTIFRPLKKKNADALSYLKTIAEELLQHEDLSPRNSRVNELLGELVNVVVSLGCEEQSKAVFEQLSDCGMVSVFRNLCQSAEVSLEEYFCQKFCFA